MERGSEVGGRLGTLLAHSRRCLLACMLTVIGIGVAANSTVDVSPASAAGPGGSWQIEQSYTPTPGALEAISCASTINCVAVEAGKVIVTGNGGANWTTESAPAGMGQINAISCPSATTCTVVGYGTQSNLPVAAVTTNSGASWTNQNLPTGLLQLTGISCFSTLICSAVGGWSSAAAPSAKETAAIVTTTNGGATWTPEAIPADSEQLDGISCRSASNCVAVGSVPYPTNNCSPFPTCPVSLAFVLSPTNSGTTWSGEVGSSPGPDEGDSFQSVSCPATSECMAVGSTNGTGEQLGIAEGVLLSGTCTLVTGCGSPDSLSTGVLTSVSCFSASNCTAVGAPLTGFVGQIATAVAAGWTTQNAPLGTAAGVACPSASECMASGGIAEDGQPGAVAETTNGGTSWAAVFSFPYAVSSLFAASCPSPSVCTAVGGSTGPGESSGYFGPGEGPGEVLNSTDGGAGWTRQTLPAGTGPLSAISCASTSVCEALGSDPYVGAPFIVGTTDGGATWQSQIAPSGIQYLTALSCSSTTKCTGVGEASGGAVIFDTTDGGTTWTTETAPTGLSSLTSMACPSVMVCTAVGQTNAGAPAPNAAIVDTTDGGTTWTTAAAPTGVFNLTSIACPTLSGCMAIGHATASNGPLTVISTSDGGATWTSGSFPSSKVAFANDIACASATACTVVGEATAGGDPGLVLATSDGGATWTSESAPAANDYMGISCPAVGACTAVGVQTASATGGALIIGQAPFTSIVIPSSGTTLSGRSAVLDAFASASAGVATVKFAITGGSYSKSVIGTAVPTFYGYIFEWNTTTVPDGAYALQSLATDDAGTTIYSAGLPISVNNLPTTSVVLPSNGATLSGSFILDASASNATSVEFWLLGGSYGYSGHLIGAATPTYFGWLYSWNTETISNGSYILLSEAFNSNGHAFSPLVTIITVLN